MATATKTKTKAETPFSGKPGWEWNRVPQGGVPTRTRSQSIVSEGEAKAGEKLIAEYRAQQAIFEEHDIDGKSAVLAKSYQFPSLSGYEQEMLRRSIAAADHGKHLAAQARLAELRKEAFELVKPIFKRLIESLDDELNDSALEAEQRLDRAGVPVRNGDEWMLHNDAVCKALWSCRNLVEKTFCAVAESGDGIAAVQWYCTSEEHTPFQWVY
jgi:hypothetical protein